MKRLLIPAALLSLASGSAEAQTVFGQATVIDGDTLDMGGTRFRLLGIDAPEADQTCIRDSQAWSCGEEAARWLAATIADNRVTCQQRDRDQYDRAAAVCQAAGKDLAGAMIDAGLAVALPQFSSAYVQRESGARKSRLGIWGSEFQQPMEYRASHPQPERAITPPPAYEADRPITTGSVASTRASTTRRALYRNCAEVRAAGAAPLRRGQPGYRPEMDGDLDGIACEPLPRG
jgi:endonuclease YncB( thermonuclease family)